MCVRACVYYYIKYYLYLRMVCVCVYIIMWYLNSKLGMLLDEPLHLRLAHAPERQLTRWKFVLRDQTYLTLIRLKLRCC